MTREVCVFLALMIVSSLIALRQKDQAMTRTIVTLAAAWLLNWSFVTLTQIYSPWLWFVIVDTLAAVIVLRHPAGKVQALIGTCFLVQVAINIGYGANVLWNGYNFDAEVRRWEIDYGIGLAKLFLIAGWGLSHVRVPRPAWWRRSDAVPRAPHS